MLALLSPYGLVFLGVILLSEVVLIPALYFAWIGQLDFQTTVITILAAEVVADTLTYGIARLVPDRWRERIPGLRTTSRVGQGLQRLFSAHGLRILFVSRFIYGSRLVVQGLCGLHRLPYWQFISVAFVGNVAWSLLMVSIIALVDASVGEFETLAGQIQIAAGITVGIGILAYLAYRYLAPRWSLPRGGAHTDSCDDDDASESHDGAARAPAPERVE